MIGFFNRYLPLFFHLVLIKLKQKKTVLFQPLCSELKHDNRHFRVHYAIGLAWIQEYVYDEDLPVVEYMNSFPF